MRGHQIIDSSHASQAKTILHEASHFNSYRLPGTNNAPYEKEFYGTKDCLQLAKDDPAHAVHNADTYAYFSMDPADCRSLQKDCLIQ
ncbi:hypothetical protein HGRIS_008792 [Hohenbuehelia grisea]|uniref:Lysine-specific metallo-endopeptidase domain-containing protein n=1 Tax=Hohenbuehelia grisea TaxID=104357 RepID=A0ABR3J952_9AGAR